MRSLKKLTIILLSFSALSCGITPPNIEVCGKLDQGAHCNQTQEENPRTMTDVEWNEVGRISMSVEAWGEVVKYIKDSCNRSKRCEIKDKTLVKEYLFNEEINK